MESGFYWVRHPGGKWQPGEVIDWGPDEPGWREDVTVQMIDDPTLWPAKVMEFGPKLEIPAELRDNQED